MERLYYVQRENATAETSDRFEAARLAAEWIRRGYEVNAIAVDVTDKSVQLVDGWDEMPADAGPAGPPAARRRGGELSALDRVPTG